ncbi:helix-turn-helix domain-containing protein [Clostridium boliviensis]|uniref:Helix-turn-helix domain-containing protein n=1 Tax=Clostridium boliviensis TaxID=318465 RepID=A0ABU4GMF3_9CLOT|nr:helix-turn-helix domain-containing protein [Clostridium boliviensis]MDW2798775.1 helix-turn-helix domain-containing protein [Clostridium boliviensis]
MIVFNLKSLLDKRGMTQTELARKAGIREATMSAILNNTIKEVSVINMEKICDTLDCAPGDFIDNIPAADFEKRRNILSKEYFIPTTTREEREKIVNDALALSTLDAPEPTRHTKQLADQFIEGNISEEDMLRAAIERYQQ